MPRTLPYLLLLPATLFLCVFFLYPFTLVAWESVTRGGAVTLENYQRMLLFIEQGETLLREALLDRLVELQYTRNDHDFYRGTFRVRGDVVDIFPSYEDERAVRVEFFGDTVDVLSEIALII